MGFEEFLPEEISEFSAINDSINLTENKISEIEKINQNQVYDVITSKKPGWQTIIYELINSNQLNPWDIDITLLTNRYFEKIEEIEEMDFYISSKILLAASLLLRIKSEFLLNKHIRNIDEILFGKKQENLKTIERIEVDPGDLPILIPKTPLSRLRKVTLTELMTALNKAINTETNRIKREVLLKRAKKLSEVDIPVKRTDLKERIKQLYARILTALKKPQVEKIAYSEIVGKEKKQRISSFLPILHLNDSRKLWLEQEHHLKEIYVFLYEHFEKNREKFLENLEEDIEGMKKELAEELIEKTALEKAREKTADKKQLEKEVKEELIEELNFNSEELSKEEKIDLSGFEKEGL